MSHFTVLVITKTDSQEDLDEILLPFHEFECTGYEQYVQEIDITEEVRKAYEEETKTFYKSPAGEFFDASDNQFYREFTDDEKEKIKPFGTGFSGDFSYISKDWGDGLGYRAKMHFIPEGWEEVERKYSEFKSFFGFAVYWNNREVIFDLNDLDLKDKHKYGYIYQDKDGNVKIVKRTNPNSKWDWYSVGGRWSDFFILKNGEKSDCAMKKDIDFESIRNEAAFKAEQKYDEINKLIGHLPKCESWESIRSKYSDIEEARDEYHKQPRVRELELSKSDYRFENTEDFNVSREEYVEKYRNSAIQTFAILKDGK